MTLRPDAPACGLPQNVSTGTAARFRPAVLTRFAALLLAAGCLSAAQASETTSAVVRHYVRAVHSSYALSTAAAEDLQRAVSRFVDAPGTGTLEAARQAWIHSHAVYSPTEVFRFYNGPIDAPDSGPEGLVNAWPLDEAYIDSVAGAPGAGIINNLDQYPVIDQALLISMNERDGEKNISTGYHAIEFLLWGQDQRRDGAGERPFSDYLTSGSSTAMRRALYLRLSADLLTGHLRQVTAAWEPDTAGSYAAEFLRAEPSEALHRMFTGIAMMAGDELSQERMAVPLETGDQEDEQSCFSDTTLSDLQGNLDGIRRVYTGDYAPVATGPGLAALVAAASPETDGKVRERLDTAKAALEAIPLPFDQSLQSAAGKARIEAAVTALEELSESLVEAAATQGVRVNLK